MEGETGSATETAAESLSSWINCKIRFGIPMIRIIGASVQKVGTRDGPLPRYSGGGLGRGFLLTARLARTPSPFPPPGYRGRGLFTLLRGRLDLRALPQVLPDRLELFPRIPVVDVEDGGLAVLALERGHL